MSLFHPLIQFHVDIPVELRARRLTHLRVSPLKLRRYESVIATTRDADPSAIFHDLQTSFPSLREFKFESLLSREGRISLSPGYLSPEPPLSPRSAYPTP